MFGAAKTPFGGFGTSSSGFGSQTTTPFGGSTGGLFGSKTPAAGAFGTPTFGASAPSSSGLFGGTSTGTSLFGAKTTSSTGFGFGSTTTSGGMFGGSSVFQTPQSNSFGFGQSEVTGTTIKFVPPTSSEQAQKSGISLTIKTQNQCITVMEQYKSKSVEELRLEDYAAGRKTGTATGGFGTGLFGSQTTSSGGLFGSTTTTQSSGFGFGKTSTSGGLFGQSSGGLFGAKTTSSLFGTTTTTTASGFGFGGTSGGLFGKTSTTGTSLFGATTTQSSGLFGSGFGTTTSSTGGLFGGTSTFGQPASQTSSLFGQTSKPAFGFGGTSTSAFGTGTSLFGNTSSSGGLFGSTASKPSFSFGGTSGGFGTSSSGGFGGFGTTTSSGGLFGGTSTGSSLFGNKPTGFGTTGFGATSTEGSLFGGGGLGTSGFGGFGGTSQSTGLNFGGSALGGLSNIDPSALASFQQQQLIQQQLKALANTPFGDSPLFRNLTDSAKAKSTNATVMTAVKEPLNTSQYKVLSRPAARVKPRPVSSPSLGKSHLFDGLVEEGDFSPHPLVPRRRIKKLVIKSKGDQTMESPFEEGHLKLRLRTEQDDDLISPSPEVVKVPSPEMDDDSTEDATSSQPNGDPPPEFDCESTPNVKKVENYVLTPEPQLPIDAESNESAPDSAEPNLPKCKLILKRPEYYTKPSIAELDNDVNEDCCECMINNFIVGREGYGEVKFLGVTNVYGLNIDEIVTFRRKEIEVYPDDYPDKPEVGEELNKPSEITLLKVWPNDKSTHTPVKTPERLKASGFIERIEEKTLNMNAVFIDFRPKEGAWVFKVNHFTVYGMKEEIIDDGMNMEAHKSLAKDLSDTGPLSRLANGIDFHKEDIGITREELKRKVQMKMDSLEISHEDEDSKMEDSDVIDDGNAMDQQEADNVDADDFLPASHQMSRISEVEAFKLQGMKTSLLCDDEEEMMNVSKKKLQLFSNRTLFSNSFVESSRPTSPFPKLDLSISSQIQDPLNNSVFQNSVLSQQEPSKFQKISNLFQSSVLEKSSQDQDETVASLQPLEPLVDPGIFIKCQTYDMVPYNQSLLFNKTHLSADASLVHNREFNVRWCNDMSFIHCGKSCSHAAFQTKKLPPSLFKGNFVSPASPFGLTNLKVSVEKVGKNTSQDFKQFMEECLEISLKNGEFETGLYTKLESVKLKDGVEALSDYAEKANNYKEATVSKNLPEFQLHSCVWNLVSALWGKQDSDLESIYEKHAARREAFSKWLSTVVNDEVQAEVAANKSLDEGHLAVVFSLLSGKNIRSACKVARDNKEIRLSFLLSQISGDYHIKSYIRNQLCVWEERNVDLHMNFNRLKLYVLLSGMMMWRSTNTSINICEGVSWKRALALHLWYFCSSSASINDAFQEYRNAFKGTESYKCYAPHPHPDYSDHQSSDAKTKDICYHLISLFCKRSHSLQKLLSPKTYTDHPLDYHLSWHLHEVLYALGYTLLSDEKHNLLQHSYAAQLESLGLWHWAVFVLMHIRDDTRREDYVKELLNRYCRINDDENDIMKLTEQETAIVEKFHVPLQWVHEAKALHAKYTGRHYNEALHLMRAGHWNEAHIVVIKHIAHEAIIEENYDMLKNLMGDLNSPERYCTIKNWRTGGLTFLDYIMLHEKIEDMKNNKITISSYHLEDMEGEVASVINRISQMKVETARERLCQSEMARNCAGMQKFVLSSVNIVNGDSEMSDANRQWTSIKVAPYLVDLPMPPDYQLKELRELLENYTVINT